MSKKNDVPTLSLDEILDQMEEEGREFDPLCLYCGSNDWQACALNEHGRVVKCTECPSWYDIH